MNINERIITINLQQFPSFLADEPGRDRHCALHPTEFLCAKCMDGRANLANMTHTPKGLIKPMRALGGRFEVWWSAWRSRIEKRLDLATSRGARSFMFVSYHFSAHAHLCCAGWNFDTAAARAHTQRLCADLEEVYGDRLMAVSTGFDTDTDNVILHGPRGDVSGECLIGLDEGEIRATIRRCFPQIDSQTLNDLLPYLIGNAQRVAELKENPRDLSSLGHHERVIALGEGFDWLSLHNFALINNDIDPNLDEAIEKAAAIMEGNLERARPDEEATIFTNSLYNHPGQSYREARATAYGLQKFAQNVIRERKPKLWKSGRLRSLIGVTFEPSRELKVLDQGYCA